MLRRWIASVLSILALPVSAVLLLFSLRRLVFLLAAAWDWVIGHRLSVIGDQLSVIGDGSPATDDRSPATDHRSLTTVLILAALRNEAATLPGLLASLLALDYPAEWLTVGLIDDGSTDGTAGLVDEAAAGHAQVEALHNPASLGKASALNAGLRRWPAGEIVAVYDVDARPQPDSLRHIATAFGDPAVAAAGGLIRPANGLVSLTATYGAIERLVHQQVTMRAKDRLGLAPALLGSNCAYRRSDLAAAGDFPAGAFLEDSHLTVEFARQGRRTRFLPVAVARDRVPETLRGYWRQHVRWGRGFHDVLLSRPFGFLIAGQAASSARPTLHTQQQASPGKPEGSGRPPAGLLRLELRLFSLGYLDRLALLLGVGLLAVRRLQTGKAAIRDWKDQPGSAIMCALAGLVGLNLLLPYAQIVLALLIERATPAWWLRLPLVPLFFGVDVAAAAWSAVLSLVRRPQVWTATERAPLDGPWK